MVYKLAINRVSIGITCLLWLSSCSPYRFDAHVFHPDLIPCTDHSTVDSFRENDDDLSHMKYHAGFFLTKKDGDEFFDAMLPIQKRLADKGNPWGIASMGGLLSQKLIEDYRFDHGASSEAEAFPTGIMPDSMKKDMIIALSYIYVGADIASTEHYDKETDPRGRANNDISDLVAAIERQPSDPRSTKFHQYPVTPAAWITEAKANAQQWRDQCQPSGSQ